MPEINSTSYDAIAHDYAAAGAAIANLSQYYYDAAYEVLTLSIFDPELDLLQPFYNAYLASSGVYTNIPAAAIGAVASLQAHVLNRARQNDGTKYSTIDAWLIAKAMTVPQEFADISEKAGFTITQIDP
jgi:hypothetical protein